MRTGGTQRPFRRSSIGILYDRERFGRNDLVLVGRFWCSGRHGCSTRTLNDFDGFKGWTGESDAHFYASFTDYIA